MIKFEKVRYKNILATGEVWNEVNLGEYKTNLIFGKNGEGKSTLIEAIVFSLYGKPFRKINKSQLVNSVNQKGLLTEIWFNVGTNQYMIRRGIKPNVFEIYQNGTLLKQDASTSQYQEHLEKHILSLNYKSFTQIVILGSATYVPFMQLPAQNRREVIEDLLDIGVFSTMNVLLKDRISKNKEELLDKEHEVDIAEMELKALKEKQSSIQELQEDQIQSIQQRIDTTTKEVGEKRESVIKPLNEEISRLKSSMNDSQNVKEKKNKFEKLLIQLESKLVKIDREITFYSDNDDCPTCKQGIEKDHKEGLLKELNKKKDEMEYGISELKEKISLVNKRQEEIESIEKEIRHVDRKITDAETDVRHSEKLIGNLKNDLKKAQDSIQSEDHQEEIKKNAERIEDTKSHLKELKEQKEVNTVAHSMLKDTGIKAKIISQYIPVINEFINHYLTKFDLFVEFELDDSFNEKIKSRHRDIFSYTSFSEGEKMRIDLAILLTWRAVSKMRNSISTNLLILDEILDSSIDVEAIETLIDMLANLSKDDNIFVISHRGSHFGDRFENTIEFKKERGFSMIKEKEGV